jgi:adenylate kinase
MDLVLLGAPGAGKGTQGALLAEALGIPKIATGDMLRDAVRQGTELGLQARAIMDAGKLVSDDIVLGLVRERLGSDGARGAIFDGYPRNVAQARSLDGLLTELGRGIGAVVYIDVDDDAIVRRMGGRTTDPETGVVYHHEHNPPPTPEIAGRCRQREDDREETVRHRLEVYRESTAPLVDYYREAGVPVHRVDGTRAIPQVQAEILGLLGR